MDRLQLLQTVAANVRFHRNREATVSLLGARTLSDSEWAMFELLHQARELLDDFPDTFDRDRFEKGLQVLRDQVIRGPRPKEPDFDAPSIPNLTE